MSKEYSVELIDPSPYDLTFAEYQDWIFSVRRPIVIDSQKDVVYVGPPGSHHSSFADQVWRYTNPDSLHGALVPTPDGRYFVELFASNLHGGDVREEIYPDLERALRDAGLPIVPRDERPSHEELEAISDWQGWLPFEGFKKGKSKTSKFKVEFVDPSKEVSDIGFFSVRRPFAVDLSKDIIYVGQPGSHHGDYWDSSLDYNEDPWFYDLEKPLDRDRPFVHGALAPTPEGYYFVEFYGEVNKDLRTQLEQSLAESGLPITPRPKKVDWAYLEEGFKNEDWSGWVPFEGFGSKTSNLDVKFVKAPGASPDDEDFGRRPFSLYKGVIYVGSPNSYHADYDDDIWETDAILKNNNIVQGALVPTPKGYEIEIYNDQGELADSIRRALGRFFSLKSEGDGLEDLDWEEDWGKHWEEEVSKLAMDTNPIQLHYPGSDYTRSLGHSTIVCDDPNCSLCAWLEKNPHPERLKKDQDQEQDQDKLSSMSPWETNELVNNHGTVFRIGEKVLYFGTDEESGEFKRSKPYFVTILELEENAMGQYAVIQFESGLKKRVPLDELSDAYNLQTSLPIPKAFRNIPKRSKHGSSPFFNYKWVPLNEFELSGWDDLPQYEQARWRRRADRHNRRARRFNSVGGLTGRELWALNKRFENQCAYCNKYLVWGTPDATLDHIVPLALGGSGGVENVVPSCKSCNYEMNEWDKRIWGSELEKPDYYVPEEFAGGEKVYPKTRS